MTSWQWLDESWVLVPPRPRAVIHFLGGGLVGVAPQVLYSGLLEPLAGCALIATPFLTTTQHAQIARAAAYSLWDAQRHLRLEHLPVVGLGHSLGCKLHLLACALDPETQQRRQGNILLAYSNASLRQAVPWQTSEEFDPSPAQTCELIASQYQVKEHLLVQFQQDTIDQISELEAQLRPRCGDAVQLCRLSGDHTTPISSRAALPPSGEFGPFDAIGQLLYQTFSNDLRLLVKTLNHWLQERILLRVRP